MSRLARLPKRVLVVCAGTIVGIVFGVIEAIITAILGYPEFLRYSLFSICPGLSFYPNALRAMEVLKLLPQIRHDLNSDIYFNTLKSGDLFFMDLHQIVRRAYNIQEQLDEIKLEHTQRFFTGVDSATNMPIYVGGEYLLVLLREDKEVGRVLVDNDFPDIKRELNRIARKRLAIIFSIIAVVGLTVGGLLSR